MYTNKKPFAILQSRVNLFIFLKYNPGLLLKLFKTDIIRLFQRIL
jgi:hypothetical protein